MNINSLYIILLISVISRVNSTNISKLLKRNIEFDAEKFYDNLSKECIEENQNSEISNNCIPSITLSNYKEKCASIKSELCQTFYNDPNLTKYYPICSQFPQYKEYFQPSIFNFFKQNYELDCLTDENDNLCPYFLFRITKGDTSGVLENNCKSKKCTESTIKLLKNINIDQFAAYENLSFTSGSFSYESLTLPDTLISIMESDECKSMHSNNNNNNSNNNNNDTSNAKSIKINNNILLIMLILLIFFY
ncbi:hypothetical protein BCR32DRAFT_276774 [Anaeromyces robustus]|uniref:Uncharacterized protein n=1 Tax=Anaeromyces robustus TaxID=1754192 RepID=A0A1Y1XHE1_9FUNG|nr:hypothetical protein BCR32DRAFT_276774 [Anaeromyces robustus]|eukprot:ORX84804.1 hypothetical protein BCR32DRAFT_276774 [Anaeromyces robustus]